MYENITEVSTPFGRDSTGFHDTKCYPPRVPSCHSFPKLISESGNVHDVDDGGVERGLEHDMVMESDGDSAKSQDNYDAIMDEENTTRLHHVYHCQSASFGSQTSLNDIIDSHGYLIMESDGDFARSQDNYDAIMDEENTTRLHHVYHCQSASFGSQNSLNDIIDSHGYLMPMTGFK